MTTSGSKVRSALLVLAGALLLGATLEMPADTGSGTRVSLVMLSALLMIGGIALLWLQRGTQPGPTTISLRKPVLRPVPPPTAAPGESQPAPRSGRAANPACLTLSMDALLLFHPYLCTGNSQAHPEDARSFDGVERDWAVWRLKELLARGDSRAAIVAVANEKMLIVGAYSDDFDACVFLASWDHDARHLIRKHGLREGTRLIVVNNFQDARPDGTIQNDIRVGEFAKPTTWSGVWPVIGDFVSDDHDQLAALKASISNAEWQRATDLTFASYADGVFIRQLAPFRSPFEGKAV